MNAMQRMKLSAAVSLVVLAAACADGGQRDARDGAGPRRGGTLVVALPADLGPLNPLISADKYGQEVTYELLFEPLLRYDSDLEYRAALAESWELLGDTGAVFSLRRDVHWHDGAATTADDVVFTFERAQNPLTAFPNSSYLTHWQDVVAVDSHTVRVAFAPHADPLAGLPFLAIVPRHLLDSIAPDQMRNAAFNRAPVGNGPYRFVQYRGNDRWVFEANPDYPDGLGGPPNIERVVMRIMPEPSSQVAEVRIGNVDLALAAPATDFLRLDSLPQLRAVARPSRQYFFIGWNGRHPPLDDPVVRRALTMALDREGMLSLRAGYGEVAAGPVPSFHWGYPEDVEPLPYSPDSARALLASVGIEDRNGDGRLELPDGQPFTIRYFVPAASPFNRDMAELVRADLADLGVSPDVQALEYSTLLGEVTSRRTFDAVQLGFVSDFRLNFRESFHSAELNGPFQLAGYVNPRADSLIERLERAADMDEAAALYGEFQRLMQQEQPWTIIYYYPDLFVMNERVRDADMDIRGVFTTLTDWWLADVPARSDSADHSPSPVAEPAG